MIDNRTIIAIVLIILLWSGYSIFFSPVPQTQETENNLTVDKKPSEEKSFEVATESITTESIPIVDNNLSNEKSYTVTSDLYDIVLSSKGATIKSVSFYKYRDTIRKDSDKLYLFNNSDFDLFTVKTSGTDGLNLPSNLVYTLSNFDTNEFSVASHSLKLSFQAIYNGLTIIKEYTFYPDSYHVDIALSLLNTSDLHTSGKLNISLITLWSEDEKGDFYSFTGPLTYDGSKLQEDKPKNIVKSPVIYRDFVWSGFTDKYFLQAFNPNNSVEQVFISSNNGFIENRFTTPSFVLLPTENKTFNFTTYFGPKNLEYLSVSDTAFEEALHFGFFHFLAKPLFDVLRFFNSYINNYGFSIILLTLCIKMIFWPLTQKSYKSMQGMQKLQPEMKRLKEKYSDDKQRLNQEMMSFYKDNKVNPLGGCLPILIQIPVFFSLYRVLLASIELRHSPFIFWITDLSAKDPLYITPLIMGVTMFLQQKLTPTNMDPTQEKIMLMMPVVFTFMFLNFPAGLVLYWLVNNLLTILQQLLIRRQAAK